MRILELSWEYPPHMVGGLGNHFAALVPALGLLGHDVQVVTPRFAGGEPRERAEHVSVHRVEPPALVNNYYLDAQQTNLRLESAAEALIAEAGPFDVIHAHDWLVTLAASTLKQRHKIPLVATVHATERGRGRGQLDGDIPNAIARDERWLVYEAWRVIAASRFMATEIANYFEAPADKIDVVPNGVDTRPFDVLDPAELSDFRSRFATPDERIVYHVGRVVYEKGTHLLVEAAPLILAEAPDAKLVIAGSGGMLETLRSRANQLGIGAKVYFVGFISNEERNALYKIASCAVFPSLYEPFGIVALEAMAAKCPLVVASSGGLAEVVQHNVTGITVYPNSIDSLVYGVVHTLRYAELARTRAENAYQFVKQNHNWHEIAARTARVMERVVEERKQVAW